MGKRDDKKAARLEAAAKSYIRRKNRVEHPEGEFEVNGCWYPSKKERCPVCGCVREPSGAWPYTLSQHCRSAEHMANKHGVLRVELLRVSKKLEKEGYVG